MASTSVVVNGEDAIVLPSAAVWNMLTDGDEVLYSTGGGTKIAGLDNLTKYYVKKLGSGNKIQLSVNLNLSPIIDINVGVGTSHSLTPLSPKRYVYKVDGTLVGKLSALTATQLTFGGDAMTFAGNNASVVKTGSGEDEIILTVP